MQQALSYRYSVWLYGFCNVFVNFANFDYNYYIIFILQHYQYNYLLSLKKVNILEVRTHTYIFKITRQANIHFMKIVYWTYSMFAYFSQSNLKYQSPIYYSILNLQDYNILFS